MSNQSMPYYPATTDDHAELELTIKVKIGISEKLPGDAQMEVFAKQIKDHISNLGAVVVDANYKVTKFDSFCGSLREKRWADVRTYGNC